MGKQPKVSVIVPVYNVEAYLKQCLDSIVGQTLKNIEIICVDDGSTDASIEILRDFESRDARVIVLEQANKGAGLARNMGLARATGEYLAFLDSDDYFERNMLADCVEIMDAEGSDIVTFAAWQYDEQKKKQIDMPWSLKIAFCPDHSPFAPIEMKEYLFNAFQTWPWNKLYRRSFIVEKGLEFQDVLRTNDMAFVISALALAEKISVINKPYVHYRVNTGTSLQQTNHKAPMAFWDAYLETKRRLIHYGVYDLYEQSFKNVILTGLMYNLRSVSGSEAYDEILDCVRNRAEDEFHFTEPPIDYYHFGASAAREYYRVARKHPLKEEYDIKVSVVMPSLNVASYIRKALDSVVNQTMRDIEIICVDAGSTDGTVEVLEEYAARDSRIRIIHSDKKSYGYQMNLGLNSARGKYFAIVETDDYILPTMYEDLYQIAEQNYVQVLKADFYQFYEDENGKDCFILRPILNSLSVNYYNKVIDSESDLNVFKANNVPWAGLYNIEFLNINNIRFNETPGASYQDNGFWFQVFCQAKRVYFKNTPYYCLRRDNPNSSVFAKNKVYCMCDEYDFIREKLKKDQKLEKRYASRCAFYRFKNYMWTLNRIAEEFKLEFLERFAADFRKIIEADEIESKLYSAVELERLYEIVEDPVEYYYGKSKLTYEFYRLLPPDRYPQILSRWYKETMKEDLDLENPRTFNEKTQWLKLYNATPLKTKLADKYLVRDWVASKIGAEYLIPLLGVWDKFDDIDFEALPNKFVLKANHGCGWNIVVTDKNKFDVHDAKSKFDIWMQTNFALGNGLELHYGDIQPRIIAEEYLENGDNDLYDYKVFCFGGKAESIMYLCDRKTGMKMAFYDRNWNKLPYVYSFPQNEENIAKPQNLNLLIELAEKLAQGFEFVRVDFYILNDGSLKFGEMTFTSGSGQCKWDPPHQNQVLGDMLHLPEEKLPLPQQSFADRGVSRLPEPPFNPMGDLNDLLTRQIRANQRQASKINSLEWKLKCTYAEKSEINAKLQSAYKDKTERGLRIKELEAQLEQERARNSLYKLARRVYHGVRRRLRSMK